MASVLLVSQNSNKKCRLGPQCTVCSWLPSHVVCSVPCPSSVLDNSCSRRFACMAILASGLTCTAWPTSPASGNYWLRPFLTYCDNLDLSRLVVTTTLVLMWVYERSAKVARFLWNIGGTQLILVLKTVGKII